MEDIKIEENVIVRKGKLGYRIVYPYKTNGKLNWFNILAGGSYWNLIKTTFIVMAVLFMVNSYNHDVSMYKNITAECLTKPCDWCNKITALKSLNKEYIDNITLDINYLNNVSLTK